MFNSVDGWRNGDCLRPTSNVRHINAFKAESIFTECVTCLQILSFNGLE